MLRDRDTLASVHPRKRVEAALDELGLDTHIREFEATTRTASDAARAIGCDLRQIVKTLVFIANGRPTLALVPGDRPASPAALARLLGVPRKRLKMATAQQIRCHTGYELGAVTPVGLPSQMDIVADHSLKDCEAVWLAAGTGNAMFRANPDDLVEAIGAQWAELSERPDL